MLWREGIDMRFKSCSHSHIDVVVYDVGGVIPWRASGFYGHPDARKRYESWDLLGSLKIQCDMPWIVFGDFNEITHPDEKLGWLDRDANHMRSFRECLSLCGLIDLGFVGQRFTWCNGRFGDQRTLIRLDRMVANGKWVEQFPEAQVHHFSMSASDHCMLVLFLTRKKRTRPMKKRFVFEAMWARDDKCREVIERAWDSLQGSCEFSIVGRIRSFQAHLQGWNRRVFGNVNKKLKVLKERLNQLEAQNNLHETAKEIYEVRREINEMLVREEVMWKQRSRALWLKCGDRNTKFFHATASQRRRTNMIEGLDDDGAWMDSQENIERVILDYFTYLYNSDHSTSFEASLGAVR